MKGAFRIFPSIAFEIAKGQSEERQKNMISRQFFSFSSFRYFLHFSINLSKCIWIMTYTLGGTLLLLKIRPVSRFFVDRNHINQLQAYTFFMSVLASSCLIYTFCSIFMHLTLRDRDLMNHVIRILIYWVEVNKINFEVKFLRICYYYWRCG